MIALGVIVIIVLAVLWYAYSASKPTENKPTISFGDTTAGGNLDNVSATWDVPSLSRDEGYSSYKASMYEDGTALGPVQTLAPNATISFTLNVTLIVTDEEGDGKLTAGDEFTVYGLTGMHSWRFALLWSDGSEICSQTWDATPLLIMGVNVRPEPSGGNWTITITSTAGPLALTNVTLTLKNRSGVILAPMDAVPLSRLTYDNWSVYNVVYMRFGPVDYVTVGSMIKVSRSAFSAAYRFEIRYLSTVMAIGGF